MLQKPCSIFFSQFMKEPYTLITFHYLFIEYHLKFMGNILCICIVTWIIFSSSNTFVSFMFLVYNKKEYCILSIVWKKGMMNL